MFVGLGSLGCSLDSLGLFGTWRSRRPSPFRSSPAVYLQSRSEYEIRTVNLWEAEIHQHLHFAGSWALDFDPPNCPGVQHFSEALGKCIDSPCPDHSAFGLEYPAPCRGQGAFGMTLLVSVATPAKPPPTMNRELLLGFQFMMLNKPARTEGDRPRQTDAHSPCGRLRA